MKRTVLIYVFLTLCTAMYAARQADGNVDVRNLRISHMDGDMQVRADFVLDSLTMRNNRVLVLTPVIEDKQGNTAVFRPVMITGRSQHFVYLREGSANYPDAIETRRMNGEAQTLAYKESMPYEKWMSGTDATVRINIDTCGCGNLLGSSVGSPVVFNKMAKCLFVMPQVEESPEIFIEGAAYVTYELDSITLKPFMFDNPRELNKIYSDIEKVVQDSLLTVTKVSIHGFASPEGRYDHNEYLARERAKTLLQWVQNECARKNVEVGEFSSDYTPENWSGLIDSLMNHPEFSHRDEILTLARNNDMEPDQRDNAIKKAYPQEYRYMLKNWYPYLRHADYKIGFRLGQVSLEQIRELVNTRPQILSLKQMLMAAQSYELGSEEFSHVFEVAVRMYPEDGTVNLNAACAALMSGNTAAAAEFLRKSGNAPQAINARGVLALLEGRVDDARAFFRSAADAGLAEAEDNLKLLNDNYIENIRTIY